jgi:hypothetical protein
MWRQVHAMCRRMLPAGVAVAFSALLAFAYNPGQDSVGGLAYPIGWPTSNVIWTYFRPPTPQGNVDTTSGVSIPTAVSQAFSVWQTTQLNGQTLTTLAVTRAPDVTDRTLSDPNVNDCRNVVSFAPSSSVSFSTGTIAFTQIATVAATAGQPGPPFTYNVCGGITTDFYSIIIDADMVFNPAEQFSTSTPTLAGHFDVQSTASHEFGHVLGLDHSGIAHTMMFPFGEVGSGQQRDLAVDDVVGVAFLYPADNFASVTGTISGTVSLDGSGVFAAHVIAVDRTSGAAVLDGLTSPDGTYQLVGVPPGNYNLLVQPLSGVYTLDNFSGWACGYASNPNDCTGFPQNPTNYTGKFY